MVEFMDHPLFRITSLLKFKMGDVWLGGTGFFVSVDDSTYLVTNRHLFEHEAGAKAELLRFYYLPSPGASDLEDNLVELEGGDWLTHNEDSNADVAVLPLSDFDFEQTGNIAINMERFVDRLTEYILSGSSAIAVGYPEANWYSDNTPLIRNARISSFFGTKFNGEQCFVMDAKMHNGMSGSPVFVSPSSAVHRVGDGEATFFQYDDLEDHPDLIGIHSGPIRSDNLLDLHRVWYTDVITEIIEQNC